LRRLRAEAIQYFGGHSVGSGASPEAAFQGPWSLTVYVFADRAREATEKVRTVLGGDDGPFAAFRAEPWALEPIAFPTPTRRDRARDWLRRAWARVRHPRHKP
jgi:hypothetical protein